MAAGEQMQTADLGRRHETEVVRLRDGLDRLVDRLPAGAELRGQGLRFVFAGAIVAGVYIGTTTFLAEVIRAPFEISLAIGFVLAIVTHFNLQRLYVWRNASAFALSVHHQAARYAAIAGLQYGLTAAITAILPHAFGVSPTVVYLPTVLVLSVTNFLVFRSRIFHAAINPVRNRESVSRYADGRGVRAER